MRIFVEHLLPLPWCSMSLPMNRLSNELIAVQCAQYWMQNIHSQLYKFSSAELSGKWRFQWKKKTNSRKKGRKFNILWIFVCIMSRTKKNIAQNQKLWASANRNYIGHHIRSLTGGRPKTARKSFEQICSFAITIHRISFYEIIFNQYIPNNLPLIHFFLVRHYHHHGCALCCLFLSMLFYPI